MISARWMSNATTAQNALVAKSGMMTRSSTSAWPARQRCVVLTRRHLTGNIVCSLAVTFIATSTLKSAGYLRAMVARTSAGSVKAMASHLTQTMASTMTANANPASPATINARGLARLKAVRTLGPGLNVVDGAAWPSVILTAIAVETAGQQLAVLSVLSPNVVGGAHGPMLVLIPLKLADGGTLLQMFTIPI